MSAGERDDRGAVILRDARREEIDGVAALLEAAYAEHAAAFPAPMWRNYREEIRAVADRLDEADLLVAARGGTLEGSVTLYRGDGYDRDWPAGVASLRLLAVSPAARGRGVGRVLLGACIERSRRRGCTHLGLHTAPFMRAAIHLYEDAGFVRAPERDFDANRRYGGAERDAQVCGLAYLRELSPPGGGPRPSSATS